MGGVLEADYLVVGAGASGMAFADSLITSSDAEVVIVDRRHGPGGHWNDTYPFIRLHQPSAYYGVNSMPLGADTIDATGVNAGMYERASGNEICAYYERVMKDQLLASGRVRFFPQCNYVGGGEFVSRLTGDRHEVLARNAVVDATYLEPTVPATTKPPFEVADGVRCVPVNELARVPEPPDGYVIIGAGKTAADAILYLLENGVPPSLIRWIKPREAWYLNRTFTQGGELLGTLFDGLALQLEACAEADSATALFDRLGQTGRCCESTKASVRRCSVARPSARPKSNYCDRSTERSVWEGCADSKSARSGSMTAPSPQPQAHCTCMLRRVALTPRPRRPSLPPGKSGCSPCASDGPLQLLTHRLCRGNPARHREQEPLVPAQPSARHPRRLDSRHTPLPAGRLHVGSGRRHRGMDGTRQGQHCLRAQRAAVPPRRRDQRDALPDRPQPCHRKPPPTCR